MDRAACGSDFPGVVLPRQVLFSAISRLTDHFSSICRGDIWVEEGCPGRSQEDNRHYIAGTCGQKHHLAKQSIVYDLGADWMTC